MSSIFDNSFPYNEITATTDATIGNCVKIPKFYVKNEVDENGLITRKICQKKISGYHCHPAFMFEGEETEGILIGCDTGNVETDMTTARSFINSLNAEIGITQTAVGNTFGTWQQIESTKPIYHMYNIYEHHLIALLMLTEYGTTNIKNAITGNVESLSGTYRNIIQNWGNKSEWIEGISSTYADKTIKIFDINGNFTFKNTNIDISTALEYFPKLNNQSGTDWNLSDIFIGKDWTSTKAEGSFGTVQTFTTLGDPVFTISNKINPEDVMADKTIQNPFYIYATAENEKAFFRICKFIIKEQE